MSVLSLKWRPQTFESIEGQESVQKILTHAIESDHIHPALIFSGPKGTGKTSTARILAKTLRCQKRKDFEPCNQCSSCQSIQEGHDMDVLEIDGASNNSVETIRDLKESVQYMPSSGRLRIYIIDEAHMLSQSAFNALLKTLEEPPPHVHFILATTELKKIPATVFSRCQIFHFRPLSPAVIQKKMNEICKAEKISIEDEALWMIIEQAQNSMRDALVLLDQMAGLAQGKITAENVIQVLGLTRRSVLNSVIKSLIEKDTQSILSLMEELSSADAQVFLYSLLIQIRNLLMLQLVKKPPSSLVFLIESEKDFLQTLKSKASSEDLHLLFDMCLKACEDVKKSFDPRIALEMALLRMCQAPSIEPLLAGNSLNSFKLSSKEKALKSQQKTHSPIMPLPAVQPSSTASPASQNSFSIDSDQFESFIKFIQKKEPQIAAHIKSFSIFLNQPRQVTLGYPENNILLKEKSKDPAFQDKLKKYLFNFFKQEIQCVFIVNETKSLRTQKNNKKYQEKLMQIDKVKTHPLAQNITDLFQARAQMPQRRDL